MYANYPLYMHLLFSTPDLNDTPVSAHHCLGENGGERGVRGWEGVWDEKSHIKCRTALEEWMLGGIA